MGVLYLHVPWGASTTLLTMFVLIPSSKYGYLSEAEQRLRLRICIEDITRERNSCNGVNASDGQDSTPGRCYTLVRRTECQA